MTRIWQNGEAVQNTTGTKLTTFIPIRIKRQGGRKVVVPATTAGVTMPEHDAPILTALARAFHWQRLLDEGIVASGSEIARREGLHPTSVNELLRLTLLSPAVVQSILAGLQSKTLSLQWLKNNEVPMAWDAQHALFDDFDK